MLVFLVKNKLLYNSIKHSLETKRSGIRSNTLESYDLKSRSSIDKYNDIQKKPKENKINSLFNLRNQNNNIKPKININIDLNNKNLIKVAKLPKPKLNNTNNNLESKFKIYINDSQTDNSSLINSELNINRNINTISSYNDSYIPNVKLKKIQ